MTCHQFTNALRILRSLDPHELRPLPPRVVDAIMNDPVDALIRADDPTAAIVWAAMVARGAT